MLLWHIPYQSTFSASEASRPNIRFTCDASLARNLQRSEPSRLRDKPRSQVEAVVRKIPKQPSNNVMRHSLHREFQTMESA